MNQDYYDIQRKRQLLCEIDWLKEKIKILTKQSHRNDLIHQLKEREYNYHLGIFKPNKQ